MKFAFRVVAATVAALLPAQPAGHIRNTGLYDRSLAHVVEPGTL